MNSLMEKLSGRWFIISSDIPLWLKGDKKSPAFTYSIINKNGKKFLSDEISYYKNRKVNFIKGYDLPDQNNGSSFTWRRKGLLFFMKSKWQVKLMDENAEWAVIWFSKNFFSPEGVDIISKNRIIGPVLLNNIKEMMMQDRLLKKHVKKLFLLK